MGELGGEGCQVSWSLGRRRGEPFMLIDIAAEAPLLISKYSNNNGYWGQNCNKRNDRQINQMRKKI